jgi:hypothetical protein
MKRLILLVGLFAFYQIIYGQCEKKVIFKCNKARDLKNGSIGQELPMDATISIDDWKIIITATINGETETIEGEIRDVSICKWADYLKNGKTQYKARTAKKNQNSENSIIDIESENGYTKITFGPDPETGSKLQFDVSEYTITDDVSPNNSSDKPVEKKKKQKRKSKTKIN